MWRALRVTLPSGVHRTLTVRGTKKEATAALAEFAREARRGMLVDP